MIRTVLNPQTPLFGEARYLLAEKTGIRDPSLYSGAGFSRELQAAQSHGINLIGLDQLYAD